ncbi:unnamed protein product [Brachionus calyciflorus]|uniref:DUF659 domain-containing protein n=1 Tax=Brachionus calyciflorus TaxID=104777 RepID=A0A814BPU4_9BILA|nr:unnamed protein product [Brachionus calyciflorus]
MIIRDAVHEVLFSWNIVEKVFGVVTDNASNVIKLCDYLNESLSEMPTINKHQEIFQFNCAAHILNLVLKKSFKIEGLIKNFEISDLSELDDECPELILSSD